MQVVLYGTEFCHLCEQAEALLGELQASIEYVDIADDDILLERYGVHIPVVRRLDNNAELNWPFDAAVLSQFLGNRT